MHTWRFSSHICFVDSPYVSFLRILGNGLWYVVWAAVPPLKHYLVVIFSIVMCARIWNLWVFFLHSSISYLLCGLLKIYQLLCIYQLLGVAWFSVLQIIQARVCRSAASSASEQPRERAATKQAAAQASANNSNNNSSSSHQVGNLTIGCSPYLLLIVQRAIEQHWKFGREKGDLLLNF